MIFEAKVVNSTALSVIAYNEDTQTLRLVFRSGQGYDYVGVKREAFNEMIESESVGQSFARVKGRLPSHRKVDATDITKFFMSVLNASRDTLVKVAA